MDSPNLSRPLRRKGVPLEGPSAPDPAGNFRDLKSQEGFPLLKAVAHHFELPTDGDDAAFLRYPRSSPLTLVGSPGVPPAEGR